VTAFIVPRDPSDPPSVEEIAAFCRGKMAGYKRPKAVYLLSQEEMPRTGSGKVLHRVLRERHWGASGDRINPTTEGKGG
jgi:fatty-acyl-CoA synthase